MNPQFICSHWSIGGRKWVDLCGPSPIRKAIRVAREKAAGAEMTLNARGFLEWDIAPAGLRVVPESFYRDGQVPHEHKLAARLAVCMPARGDAAS